MLENESPPIQFGAGPYLTKAFRSSHSPLIALWGHLNLLILVSVEAPNEIHFHRVSAFLENDEVQASTNEDKGFNEAWKSRPECIYSHRISIVYLCGSACGPELAFVDSSNDLYMGIVDDAGDKVSFSTISKGYPLGGHPVTVYWSQHVSRSQIFSLSSGGRAIISTMTSTYEVENKLMPIISNEQITCACDVLGTDCMLVGYSDRKISWVDWNGIPKSHLRYKLDASGIEDLDLNSMQLVGIHHICSDMQKQNYVIIALAAISDVEGLRDVVVAAGHIPDINSNFRDIKIESYCFNEILLNTVEVSPRVQFLELDTLGGLIFVHCSTFSAPLILTLSSKVGGKNNELTILRPIEKFQIEARPAIISAASDSLGLTAMALCYPNPYEGCLSFKGIRADDEGLRRPPVLFIQQSDGSLNLKYILPIKGVFEDPDTLNMRYSVRIKSFNALRYQTPASVRQAAHLLTKQRSEASKEPRASPSHDAAAFVDIQPSTFPSNPSVERSKVDVVAYLAKLRSDLKAECDERLKLIADDVIDFMVGVEMRLRAIEGEIRATGAGAPGAYEGFAMINHRANEALHNSLHQYDAKRSGTLESTLIEWNRDLQVFRHRLATMAGDGNRMCQLMSSLHGAAAQNVADTFSRNAGDLTQYINSVTAIRRLPGFPELETCRSGMATDYANQDGSCLIEVSKAQDRMNEVLSKMTSIQSEIRILKPTVFGLVLSELPRSKVQPMPKSGALSQRAPPLRLPPSKSLLARGTNSSIGTALVSRKRTGRYSLIYEDLISQSADLEKTGPFSMFSVNQQARLTPRPRRELEGHRVEVSQTQNEQFFESQSSKCFESTSPLGCQDPKNRSRLCNLLVGEIVRLRGDKDSEAKFGELRQLAAIGGDLAAAVSRYSSLVLRARSRIAKSVRSIASDHVSAKFTDILPRRWDLVERSQDKQGACNGVDAEIASEIFEPETSLQGIDSFSYDGLFNPLLSSYRNGGLMSKRLLELLSLRRKILSADDWQPGLLSSYIDMGEEKPTREVYFGREEPVIELCIVDRVRQQYKFPQRRSTPPDKMTPPEASPPKSAAEMSLQLTSASEARMRALNSVPNESAAESVVHRNKAVDQITPPPSAPQSEDLKNVSGVMQAPIESISNADGQPETTVGRVIAPVTQNEYSEQSQASESPTKKTDDPSRSAIDSLFRPPQTRSTIPASEQTQVDKSDNSLGIKQKPDDILVDALHAPPAKSTQPVTSPRGSFTSPQPSTQPIGSIGSKVVGLCTPGEGMTDNSNSIPGVFGSAKVDCTQAVSPVSQTPFLGGFEAGLSRTSDNPFQQQVYQFGFGVSSAERNTHAPTRTPALGENMNSFAQVMTNPFGTLSQNAGFGVAPSLGVPQSSIGQAFQNRPVEQSLSTEAFHQFPTFNFGNTSSLETPQQAQVGAFGVPLVSAGFAFHRTPADSTASSNSIQGLFRSSNPLE